MTDRPARPYRPGPETVLRLQAWRRGCAQGYLTADIAAALGISVGTLRRTVSRARARGHPDAVLHPLAPVPGTGLAHVVSPSQRAARARRRSRETAAQARDTLLSGT